MRVHFFDMPKSVQAGYSAGELTLVYRCESKREPKPGNRYVMSDAPPTFRVYLREKPASPILMDEWAPARTPEGWDASLYARKPRAAVVPDDAMLERICSLFPRTWDIIGGDIHDALREQAACGDKAAKKALATGTLTPTQLYEMTIDYIESYGKDADALRAWDVWHGIDHEGSKRKVCRSKQLKGGGF